MRSVRGQLVVLVVVCVSLAGLVMSGAGSADAKRGPARTLWVVNAGDTVWASGGNSNCRGPIKVTLETDPAKRGLVYATYRPGRFVGDGPGWRKRPVCRIDMVAVVSIADAITGRASAKPVFAGPDGGPAVRQTLRPGSGFQTMTFRTRGLDLASSCYIQVP